MLKVRQDPTIITPPVVRKFGQSTICPCGRCTVRNVGDKKAVARRQRRFLKRNLDLYGSGKS